MACDSLLTSLWQVFNGLVASCLSKLVNLLSAGLLQVVSTSCTKSADDKLQQVLKVTSLLELDDELLAHDLIFHFNSTSLR